MPDCSGSGSSRLSSSRRQLLGGWVLVGVASALLPAAAEQEVSTTPKAFVDLARKLTKGLIESIELEASGAEEREVRRSADASKDLVREFVQRWKSNPLVQQDPVFIELRGAVQELGNFYLANGSRARLTREVEESIVTKLYAAQAALPPEPEKKGLFGLL